MTRATDHTPEQIVELWNRSNPSGTPVRVREDDGSRKVSKTTSTAWLVSGIPVVKLEGKSGGFALHRVTPLGDPMENARDLLRRFLDLSKTDAWNGGGQLDDLLQDTRDFLG